VGNYLSELMYTVRVDEADPRFGNMLLEQFGGANGELGAAMQYSVQGLNCDDPERKDLLMDIASKSETVQGHVGLIEEGDEVIEEAKEKEGRGFGAHCVRAKNRALRDFGLRHGAHHGRSDRSPRGSALLSKSLAEEEIADNLLAQVARELMSESRTGAKKEAKHATAPTSVDRARQPSR
jgi:hypothetical protein